jgi:hypothetical protein
MKVVKRILLALAILFVAAQFVRPDMANPPSDLRRALQKPPADINAILHRSCHDCHSHHTRWPWYARITPVNFWLKGHVDEGREHLNFSEFATYSKSDAAHAMDEICEMVNKGEMPLKTYLPLHPEARLSSADKNRLCEWANAERQSFLTSPPR